MIVGCYSMDLYCDGAGVDYGFHSADEAIISGPAQFLGETYGECAAKARKAGWKLVGKFGKAFCPRCAKKRNLRP